MSRIATVGFVALFSLFVVAVALFGAMSMRYSERAYPGLEVAGADIGGMTRGEVAAALDPRFLEFANTRVTLTSGDDRFERTAAELGMTIDRDATIDRVMEHGRTGSLWQRSLAMTRGATSGTVISPIFTIDDAVFRQSITDLAPEIVYAPSDARVDMSVSGQASMVDDVPGLVLDVSSTRRDIVRALAGLQPVSVPVSVVPVPAAIQTADIESGLPAAQRAVGSAIEVSSEDGVWGMTTSRLNEVVTVTNQGEVKIDRPAVQAFIEQIATSVDHPAENAQITVDDAGGFLVVEQVNAATVDVDASTDALVTSIRDGAGSAELVVSRQEPQIETATAQEWADRAEGLISDGLKLTWHGGSSQLGRADLLAALVIEPTPDGDEQFSLSFDEDVISERLVPLQEDLYIEEREAQFRLVDGDIRFQAEARKGRELDMEASVETILGALESGDDAAAITVSTIEPTYTSASRSSISLPDVLGQSQTYYGTSSDPRRHNVERATEIEDGWLIPPDGEFSFAQFMGLVDEDNGFVTGFGIVADPSGGVTTAPVIGGGICQVSTTIFQAAFWAGLPITERWAHPYWLQGYGQAPYGMQGLDAMVNIEPDWALDLKFKNTTGNWIALSMDADGENVYAEIRGTNPGWAIDVDDPAITDVVKPSDTMMFTDSPELPKGQELQVEHAREGFTSRITRVVKDNEGKVVDEYVLESTYSASRNLTLRGTGGDENR